MNRQIKICFIAPKAYPLFVPETKGTIGGAEVDLYLLAKELAKDDNYQVSFITADYGQNDQERIDNVAIIKSLDFQQSYAQSVSKIWKALN